MPRRYYLGLNAGGPGAAKCLFTRGNPRDLRQLSEYLSGRYQGAPILTKNGRSALTIALKSYFDSGDKVIVNGFTCHAVYEAILEAGMTPVFADINRENLNFDIYTLDNLWEKSGVTSKIKGIIVQNTLGNPVDIRKIEKFASKHDLIVIEDLAHSPGIKYPDGRDAGTIGVATVLSFGKDKAINAISGGAAILRHPCKTEIEAPFKVPRTSDRLRARFYPLFCKICRGLNYVHLGGMNMRFLQKIHWVERSADSTLDITRGLTPYQARLALEQFKKFHHRGEGAVRDFYLVHDREEVLRKLRRAGYYFDAFWYEKPVAPERYYEEVQFPEKDCPVATEVAGQIINFPKYYSKKAMNRAQKIIQPYIIKESASREDTNNPKEEVFASTEKKNKPKEEVFTSTEEKSKPKEEVFTSTEEKSKPPKRKKQRDLMAETLGKNARMDKREDKNAWF